MTVCQQCGATSLENATACPSCGGPTSRLGEGTTHPPMPETMTSVLPAPSLPSRSPLAPEQTAPVTVQSRGLLDSLEQQVGQLIGGRYEVLRLIGRGGMGAVFLARDRQLQRSVAIKRLVAPEEGAARGIERFLREARAIAALNYRHIVTLYELSSDALGPYIALEYLGGGDLQARIRAKGKLDLVESTRIIEAVGRALTFAHKRSIFHRDVKPSNIMLADDGTPKLADFGLATMMRESDATSAGEGMGTLAYMAPEQRKDARHADHRSDIYALGKTLVHMLSGSAPYTVNLDTLPPEVREAIAWALQAKPEDRPFSVEHFIHALRKGMERSGAARAAGLKPGTCPACGVANAETMRFCQGCGASLFEACPSCGEQNRIGVAHCGSCGVKVTPFRVAREAMQKAQAALQKSDYTEAMSEARRGLATEYFSHVLNQVLAQATEQKQAIEQLRTEALTLIAERKYDEAKLRLNRITTTWPNIREAAEAQTLLLSLPGMAARHGAELEMSAFRHAEENGNLDEALKHAEAALRYDAASNSAELAVQRLSAARLRAQRAADDAMEALDNRQFEQALQLAEAALTDWPMPRAVHVRTEASRELLDYRTSMLEGQEALSHRDYSAARRALHRARAVQETPELLALVDRLNAATRRRRVRRMVVAVVVPLLVLAALALWNFQSNRKALAEAQAQFAQDQTEAALGQLDRLRWPYLGVPSGAALRQVKPLQHEAARDEQAGHWSAAASAWDTIAHTAETTGIERLKKQGDEFQHRRAEAAAKALARAATAVEAGSVVAATEALSQAYSIRPPPTGTSPAALQVQRLMSAREQFEAEIRKAGDRENLARYVPELWGAIEKQIKQAAAAPGDDLGTLLTAYEQQKPKVGEAGVEAAKHAAADIERLKKDVLAAKQKWQTTASVNAPEWWTRYGGDDWERAENAMRLATATEDPVAAQRYWSTALGLLDDAAKAAAKRVLLERGQMQARVDELKKRADFSDDNLKLLEQFGGDEWTALKKRVMEIEQGGDLKKIADAYAEVITARPKLTQAAMARQAKAVAAKLADEVAALRDQGIEHVKSGRHEQGVALLKQAMRKQTLELWTGDPELKRLLHVAQNLRITLTPSQGGPVNIVGILPGQFTMGSPFNELLRQDNERPHRVKLTRPYYLGVTEVTWRQYSAIMRVPIPGGKDPLMPADSVSHSDAVRFCMLLSEQLRKDSAPLTKVRLPTEAEWEYACRAGTTTRFSFGDTLGNQARISDPRAVRPGPTRVGSFKENPWGLSDMHGNVAEWCADHYDGDFGRGLPGAIAQDVAVDPCLAVLPGSDAFVLRGGSWNSREDAARSASRDRADRGARSPVMGFRIAIDVD